MHSELEYSEISLNSNLISSFFLFMRDFCLLGFVLSYNDSQYSGIRMQGYEKTLAIISISKRNKQYNSYLYYILFYTQANPASKCSPTYLFDKSLLNLSHGLLTTHYQSNSNGMIRVRRFHVMLFILYINDYNHN